jgi:uncharacterized protein
MSPSRHFTLLHLALVWAMLLSALASPFATPRAALAAGTILLGAASYGEDFDSLANSGAASTTPNGWYFAEAGTNANATYSAGTGSATAGDTYSFGAAGATERAFGGLQSGSLVPTIGASFTNDTGATITQLDISYSGEQWRLGTSGRADRLDFQYSTDAGSLTSGSWTNLDALDFIGPISAGTVGALDGNLAANRRAISGSIAGLNIAPGASIWLRWSSVDVTGADDGLAVDDLSVAAVTDDEPPGDAAPDVQSSVPANNATAVSASADLTVTFSEPVNALAEAFALVCNGSPLGFALAGGPTTFTLNPDADLPEGASCTLTVSAAQVTDQDTNDPPDAMAADYQASFTVAAPPCFRADTPIGLIQGEGATNTANNQSRTVQGVVVGDYEGAAPNLRGFYLQNTPDNDDNDPKTSDGIFVFVSNNTNQVSLGQLVQVAGIVNEGFNQTQIGTTSTVPTIEVCGPGSLPAPTSVDLPASAADLERYEGMLVTFPEQLSVSGNFTLARFGELVLSAEGRNIQPTNVVDPTDANAAETQNDENNAVAVQSRQNLNLARRILLDDGLSAENPATIPYIDANNTRRLGDTISGLTGVLGFGFSAFRVQPVPGYPIVFTNSNPRPTTPPLVGSASVRVASFNVLNYFNDIDAITTDNNTNNPADDVCGPPSALQDCRGADSVPEFTRQRNKVFAAVRGLDADVVGLIEIENDGDSSSSAIFDLVSGLNASLPAGALPYTYTLDPAGYGARTPLVPGGDDAIKVAFIYRPGRVTPVGAPLTSGDIAFENGRAPVAQTFSVNSTGAVFTPIINHFKSKSGTGTGDDADQNDGQGNFNASRVAQANALLRFISSTVIPAASDIDVLILGDLNGYTQEDPVDVLRAGGFTNLIDDGDAYSYQFQNQSGSLDHALTSASLGPQVTGATKWHINADEPIYLDYNLEFKAPNVATPDYYQADPFSSSDHDPVLVGLDPINLPPTIAAGGAAGVCPAGNGTSGIGYFLSVDDDAELEALEVSVGGLAAPVTSAQVQSVAGEPALRQLVLSVAPANQVRRVTLTLEVSDGWLTASVPVTVIVGSADNDDGSRASRNLSGTAGADIVLGLAGNDVLGGGAGNDLVCGGDGNDVMAGGDGDDTLRGGDGNDEIDAGAGDDYADGANGNDVMAGGAGDDMLLGGDGNDVMAGGDGNDTLSGALGNDTMTGGAGTDSFDGGDGIDTSADFTPGAPDFDTRTNVP